jgi:hypothetical protein
MIYSELFRATVIYEKWKIVWKKNWYYSSAVDVNVSSTVIRGSGGCSGAFCPGGNICIPPVRNEIFTNLFSGTLI